MNLNLYWLYSPDLNPRIGIHVVATSEAKAKELFNQMIDDNKEAIIGTIPVKTIEVQFVSSALLIEKT